jgi:hypothetical protein
MNTRERTLAILLIGTIVSVAGGFAGYLLVWDPLNQANDQLKKVATEIKDLQDNKDLVLAQQNDYETKTRKKSLPADTNLSMREYTNLIEHMLRQAKFAPAAISVSHKQPNDKSNVPLLSGKKAAYTMLDFDVIVKGDLVQLVEFLYNFYRQPLLHQIKTLTILKASARNGDTSNSRDLNINLSIEALVLDQAEDRKTLMATVPSLVALGGGAGAMGINLRNVDSGLGSPFTVAGVLARGEDKYTQTSALSEYKRIAGKNIFFDPLIERQPSGPRPMNEIDSGPYLKLIEITHSNGVSKATINDRLRNELYEVNIDSRNAVVVNHFWFDHVLNSEGVASETVRKKYQASQILVLGNEKTGTERKYSVRRILEHELVLEPFDLDRDAKRDKLVKGPDALILGGAAVSIVTPMPPKILVWRVGQFFSFIEVKRGAPASPANADPIYASIEIPSLKANLKYTVDGKELTAAAAIRDYLTRPIGFTNEGNGIVELTSDADQPPDPNDPGPKKAVGKRGGDPAAGAGAAGAGVPPNNPRKKGKGKGGG